MNSPSFSSPSDDAPNVRPSGEDLSQFRVANPPDNAQLTQFVTTIKNAEQQVGENIIEALKHPGSVAVLTTAVLGPDGQQRVLSMALDADRMSQVQEMLESSMEEREDEEPCYGFHCLVKTKAAKEPTSSKE
ncbi:putative transmembrane protein [Rhodopirellula islandica]|uniref:Transmembrane protein n=1 Tax=Rhodopirellula islandica TaxID=595434 RepID=A0A0J1EM34_RHOIS|nr:hypothetical protein [Rhodopirellula islandica]KLU06609.1 putative transmembrane protein [Rhodopirellula islandica]